MREKIKGMKIEMMLARLEEYSFPQFLSNLRKIFGTRKMISDETGIPYHRLECLESGRNIKIPDDGELLILEQFFGLPPGLLLKKAKHTHYKLAM